MTATASRRGLKLGIDADLKPADDGGPAGLYKQLLASYPTGVACVTAYDREEPRGLTVNAFCGVSLEPPLVLTCIDRTSNTLPAIMASDGFTVNFVSADSARIAQLMATKASDKFQNISWEPPAYPGAGPVLVDDASAHILCRTRRRLKAGDHWIVIGEVVGGEVHEGKKPLVFHQRRYVKLGGADSAG
jgi:flavin reductase (DIM6/NTAB) family NADH-FMN oxidoreductase RutF